MNTTENNKLIAEFMGIEFEKGKYSHESSEYYFVADELEYDFNWNWLMPVVEKIAKDYHKTEIVSDEETDHCRITVYNEEGERDNEIFECGLSTLEATYKAVVEFIKWYNQNK